jgi:hypothetical protein
MFPSIETIMRLYRGVVALNNAAVSLMEKHGHCQASAVLKDALAALKVLQGASEEVNVYDLSPLLANAAKSTANCKPHPCSQVAGCYLMVQVLSDCLSETNLKVVGKTCQQVLTQTESNVDLRQITAIRIDLDDVDYLPANYRELLLAVVMHNYGLSLTCISYMGNVGVERHSMLRKLALNMFTLSSTLLFKQLSNPKHNNYFSHMKMLYLHLVILMQLYQSMMDVGMVEKATSCLFLIQSHWIGLNAIDVSGIPGLLERLAPAA